MSLYAKDALLIATFALPNGAASTTPAAGIDLDITPSGELAYTGEFELVAPALTTGQLADAATMTYDVILSANANLSSPTIVSKAVLVQTGASGAGAATATVRFRLPMSPGGINSSLRYVGVKATNSGAGNASTVSATLSMVF